MKKPLWERVKKHPLLLLLFGLVLLLIIVLLAGKQLKGRLSVPIAMIDPSDTLTLAQTASRLEAYEQKQKESSPGTRPSPHPIALDYGQLLKERSEAKAGAGKQQAQFETAASALQPVDSLSRNQAKSRTNELTATEHFYVRKSVGKAQAPKQRKLLKAAPLAENITQSDGFYTLKAAPLDQNLASSATPDAFYRAVVEGKQKISPNGTVKMRLLESIPFAGKVVPTHTLLFGQARMSSQGRIQIKVHFLPAAGLTLTVYDFDYQAGIAYQWQEPVTDAVREGKEQALEDLWNALPYGGIAGSAVDLGKNLSRRLSGKRSLVLADHYPLLLKVEESSRSKPAPPSK